MINQSDIRLLTLIVEKCERLIELSSGHTLEEIENNYLLSDAIQFEFEKLYEDTTRLSAGFRLSHQDLNYDALRSIRNRVAHDYESVVVEILVSTALNNIPTLKKEIQSILESDVTQKG